MVARKALVRLMAKLENQSSFTQTAYPGGEKGGLTAVEEMDVRVTFGSARSRICSQDRIWSFPVGLS